MEFDYQPRTFLLLEDPSPATELARQVLDSPLDQVKEIVRRLFRGELASFGEKIDAIKSFAAGVSRAKSLRSYPVANYYSLMFAFQQWFHSSYRARQGKVLEGICQRAMDSYTSFQSRSSRDAVSLLQRTFNLPNQISGDIDVFGVTSDYSRLLAIQLRSRDDTGGTTAKGSLLDILRQLLRDGVSAQSSSLLYLVGIWDKRDTQQRASTIHKFYDAIRDYIPSPWNDFARQIGQGIFLSPSLCLQLAYGVDEILQAILDWDPSPQPMLLQAVQQIVQKIEQWDDLWVAYAIASIELEIQALRGISNISLLMEKCAENDIDLDHRSWKLLQDSIERAVELLIPRWTDATLPVQSPADQALYLRDLLFLRAIYEKECCKEENAKRSEIRGTGAIKEPLAPYQATFPFAVADFNNAPSSYPVPVNFRELVPEISDTSYLTHGLFYYPAKFIPQIPRFCLQKYTVPGDWVIDPFAGSATVGLEAALTGRGAILLDINPLLNYIVPVKILFHGALERQTLQQLLGEMIQAASKPERAYRPAWSNLDYWYEPKVLEVLCRYWGWVKNAPESPYRPLLEIALLKASKHFSYAEHKTPKLFKSKTKRSQMEALLQTDWKSALDHLIFETAFDAYRRIMALTRRMQGNDPQILYYGGVDSADKQVFEREEILAHPTRALITSPPYLQAQEYIRTAKLELYWLGYTEEEIKAISRLEIPYRKAEGLISTPTFLSVYQNIRRADLRSILASYFYYTLRALENAAQTLLPRGVMCVFVGNPKVDGLEVETWRVVSEYFSDRGYSLEGVYEDEIKNRQLFRNRRNKNPEGMKSEFLLVMRKE